MIEDDKALLLSDKEDKSLQKYTSKQWKTSLGILIIIVECLCSIGSISCLQIITRLPPNFELNSLRFAIGLLFVITYLLLCRQLPRVPWELTSWLFLAVLATYVYNLTLFSEYVKQLPIGAVFGINQGFEILLVAIASRILLHQEHSWFKVALILTTFVGIGLVISSSFLPGHAGIKERHHNRNDTNFTLMSYESYQQPSNPNSTEQAIDGLDYEYSLNDINETITSPKNYYSNIETGFTTESILIAIGLLFACAVSLTTESLAISGTPLREINSIFLSFWYFLFGSIASPLTSLTFENMFIPETMTDKICSLVHCTLASVATFLYILVLKLLDANLVAIVYSIHIPLALTTQMFLLQSVTPPVELWVLVLGLVIITFSVFGISMNAICNANNS